MNLWLVLSLCLTISIVALIVWQIKVASVDTNISSGEAMLRIAIIVAPSYFLIFSNFAFLRVDYLGMDQAEIVAPARFYEPDPCAKPTRSGKLASVSPYPE